MKHNQETIDAVLHLKREGLSNQEAANILGIGKTTVHDIWHRHLSDLSASLTSGMLENKPAAPGPKILFFDLESSPSIVATFGRWKQNIGPESVVREGGFLLSACWKFLGESEITKVVLTPEQARAGDDLQIVCGLFEAFKQADAVSAHNLVKFDFPLFKTRLIANGMPPPKLVKLIDTLQIAKSLRFNSNKLDSLGNYLQVGRKIQTTGMGLWLKCMEGDREALQQMLEYNEQDVILLEKVYMQLRAFDPKPVNAGHYYQDGKVHCQICGSTNVEETGNKVYTYVSEFAEVVCNDCGHRSRTRKTLNSKDKRSNLLVS